MNEKKSIRPIDMLTSFLTLFVFVTIDYFSIGCRLFAVDGLCNYPSTAFFSGAVFLFTTYLAQICYTFCSSIATGVVASIVFEAVLVSRKISATCFSVLSSGGMAVSPADLYANIFICMGISTALFSLLSLVPYIYRAGSHLKDLPLLAVFSMMTAIGVCIFNDAIGEYLTASADAASLGLLGISLTAGFIIFVLEQAFPDFAFLVPLSAFTIVLGFNLLFRVLLGQSTSQLQEAGLLLDLGRDANLQLRDVFSAFDGASIRPACILSNISNILSLVLFNLIHINTNLLSYSHATQGSIDFDTEWRVQSISNFLTMFTGFPSYFVSSTSIVFYRAGGRSRAASAAGIMVPAFIALLAPYMRSFVPRLLSSIILSYIGMAFIYSYFVRTYQLVSRTDFLVVTLGVVFSQAVSFAAGFALVAAICAISALRSYRRVLGAYAGTAGPPGNVVRVDYILCFITISKLKQDLAAGAQEVTLDLTACPYIDANGNAFILDYAREITRMQIVGCPDNLYVDILGRRPNIHLLDTSC